MVELIGYLITECPTRIRVTKLESIHMFGQVWKHSVDADSGCIYLESSNSVDDLHEAHLHETNNMKREVLLRNSDINALESDALNLTRLIQDDVGDQRNHDTDAQVLLASVMMQGRHLQYIDNLTNMNSVFVDVKLTVHKATISLPKRVFVKWKYKSEVKSIMWCPLDHTKQTCDTAITITETYHNVELPVRHMVPCLAWCQEDKLQMFEDDMKLVSGCTSDGTYLYVADDNNHRIIIFDISTGQAVRRFGHNFNYIGGICVDHSFLYACDWKNDRIQIFKKDTCSFVRFLEYRAKDIACYGYRIFLLLSTIGMVEVRDTTKNYELITQWGSQGIECGQFDSPWGICVDEKQVYISDSKNHRVQVFDHSGTFLFTFGSLGSGPQELYTPKGISVWKQFVMIADCVNDRIQVYKTNGEFWETLNLSTSLKNPYKVHVDDTHIFISDTGHNRVIGIPNEYGLVCRKIRSGYEASLSTALDVVSLDNP